MYTSHGTVTVKHCLWRAAAVAAQVLLWRALFRPSAALEESDIQRVEQKQVVLATEQEKSTRLQQEEEQLAADLSERQLSLDQFNARVQEINAENGRAIALNGGPLTISRFTGAAA